ncbi:MAG TPA: translocation/assembly module TamB domain-containing protein [Polyangia bacterium]|nr:translocation/assembly module TamB domain-containing protein [Polyangia bacterium]
MRLRAVLRVTGLLVFAVLAAVLLAVGGLWTFAETPLGGRVIRRIATTQLNRRIAGDVAVAQLRFGGDRLTLDGIILRDPAGAAVARIGSVDVEFSPWALLRRRVEVRRLAIRRPELQLALDARGSNLARVFAPAHPAPPAPAPAPANPGGPNLVVEVAALSVTGGALTIRSSAPEVHVAAIEAEGSARYDGPAGALRAELRVVTEAGRVEARGDLDLARGRPGPAGLAVHARDLDLGALMRDLPATQLALDLTADGDRASVDLDARAPGATVRGHGTLDGEEVDATLRVEASDLAATARSLARCRLAPPVALAGQGRIDLAVHGPRTRPAVRLAGRIPRLTVGHDLVRGLTVSATLPRLDAPTAVDLDLAADGARVSGRTFGGVTAKVRAAGRGVTAEVRVARPLPLALVASGRRLSPSTVEIARLALRTPEASWATARPLRLTVGGGRLALAGLDLRSGDQVIAADLEKAGRRGHLRLHVARLDPARLPRLFVPPAAATVGPVNVDLDLTFARARARGHVAARALGTGLDATFDLPLGWPPRRGRAGAPLALELTTEEIDLATIAGTAGRLTGRPWPYDPRGKLRLSATVDGDAAHPRLSLQVEGRALALAGRPLGDLTVDLEGDDDHPLALRLRATRPAEPPATLTASTSLTLRALLERRPSRAALLRTPFEIEGQIERAEVARLAKLAGLRGIRGGTLSIHVAARGTAREPTGTVALDLNGVAADRFPATDARLELTLDRRATLAHLRVVRLGHPLLALEARLGADVAALADRHRLVEAPLSVRAVVGPLDLRRLGLPPVLTGGAREAALRGQLHADLSVDGTLGAPRAVAHVQAGDLRLDEAQVGYANLEARYAEGKAHLELRGASANGGTVALHAGLELDLGLPALRARKIDPLRLPFDVRLEAEKLDLRVLSGVTPAVRRVGGLLDAQVAARGTLRDPHFSGRIDCTGCEAQLAGVGEFREVHLALHGDTDKIVLEELSAKNGEGNGRVTGSLTRDPKTDSYRVEGAIAAKEIPVYQEGQPLAHVSLDANVAGTSGGRGSAADVKVAIRDAHLKLSDEKRRQLQPMRTPDDVVVVDDGQPVDRAQAKKLRALAGRASVPPGLGAPGSAAPAPPSESQFWKRINVTLEAPRQLWVNGGGANLELGLEPGFQIVLGRETRLHGQVIVRRGRVDVLGKRFDLKADSTLQFDGAPDRPTLDATAQYIDNSSDVVVLLTAKGPLDHLSISVTSANHPELNESQLYALIITGHLPGSTGTGSGGVGATASNEATSLVAGVIAGQLQKTLSRHLPLDVLTIDSGSGQGFTGTQLEAGRYVTERLYVGYVGRVGADPTRYQNKNAVHIEYQLSQRWQVAGEYGDVGTGSADLMWRKNY